MATTVNTTTSAILEKDEQLTTKISKYKTHLIPPFQMLGRPGAVSYKDANGIRQTIQGFDPMPIFKELSAGATKLFWTLAMKRDIESNLCHHHPNNLTEIEINLVKKHYSKLAESGLVKRIKTGYYMINPRVFIPIPEHYPAAQFRWDQSNKGKSANNQNCNKPVNVSETSSILLKPKPTNRISLFGEPLEF